MFIRFIQYSLMDSLNYFYEKI